MMRKMRPAASLRGRDVRQDDALLRRRRGWRLQVDHPAAVHQRHRRQVLFDAVLVDLDLVLRQVGYELVAAVAGDDVGRHQIDCHPEIGRRGLRGRRRGRRRLCLTRRGDPGGPQHHTEREPGTDGEAAVAHGPQYRPRNPEQRLAASGPPPRGVGAGGP